jgi:hypothetical protein
LQKGKLTTGGDFEDAAFSYQRAHPTSCVAHVLAIAAIAQGNAKAPPDFRTFSRPMLV